MADVQDIAEQGYPEAFTPAVTAGMLHYIWQAPLSGPPDYYRIYLGDAPGSETLLDTVAGSVLGYDYPRAPGPFAAYVTAVTGGEETGPSNKVTGVVSPPAAALGNLLPAGATRRFQADGFEEPSQAYTVPGLADPWEIIFVDPATAVASVVATSERPNGWGVGRLGVQLYVHCPPATLPSKGYKLRMEVETFF